MIALTVLGMRYVEADKAAVAELQRDQQRMHAEAVAQGIVSRATEQADGLIGSARARFATDGAQGLRNMYLSKPDLALVVVFDDAGTRVFPEPQEVPLFAEAQYLQLGRTRLAEARTKATAHRDQIVWAGTLSDVETPMAACQARDDLTVCLLLQSAPLLKHAGEQPLETLGAETAPPDGVERVRAPLAEPYSGFAVAVDYPPIPSRGWRGLALMLGPTALGTGLAAWLLFLAQRTVLDSERRRQRLLAEMSHELRTPLANLRLYSDMLTRDSKDADRVQRYARVIEKEAAHLSDIVDNTLIVTVRGGSPRRTPSMGVADQVVVSVLDRYGPSLIGQARPQLDLQAAGTLRFDRDVFERVLVNVLDNARKHAPGTDLRIATRRKGETLELEICDTGPTRDTSPKRAPRPKDTTGFGLGLGACQTMAEQAGGRFRPDITPQGSRFILELPIHPDSGEAQCVS